MEIQVEDAVTATDVWRCCDNLDWTKIDKYIANESVPVAKERQSTEEN